ncbi:MAG: hypothetical protein ACE5KJ_05055 [Candidatus Zixiibacteriota bacterium]
MPYQQNFWNTKMGFANHGVYLNASDLAKPGKDLLLEGCYHRSSCAAG